MFTGYNSEVELDGEAFHVQTEDKGLDNPVVESFVYRGGQVVASVLTSYADLADSPDYTHKRIQRRMQEQHQSLIEDLRGGRLEAEPTVRRKALDRILDSDNLVEEYVEDWIDASNSITPVHRALEKDIDEIQKKEVDGLSKKKSRKEKRPRSHLALLVVLISIGAAFELGRVSQRSPKAAAAIVPPAVENAAAAPWIGPVLDEHPAWPVETEASAATAEQPVVDRTTPADTAPPEEVPRPPKSPEQTNRQPVVEATTPESAPRIPAPELRIEDEVPQPIESVEREPLVTDPLVEAQAIASQPPQPLPGPFEMDQVEQAPTSVATQLPVYTPAAIRAASEGSVRLKVLVGPDGSIDAIRMLDEITDSDLNKATISAILHWRFNPGSHRGQPVSVWVPVRLDFSLSKNQMRSVVSVTQ